MNWVDPIRTKAKIDLIKDHLRSNPRNYLLFVLGINAALRISDLLSLKLKDVYEDGKVKDQLVITEQKTGKQRSIPLEGAAKEVLKWYAAGLMFNPYDMEAYLFKSTQSDQPITRHQAHRLIKEWTRLVGLTGNYGTHTLRKTWGYWARKGGAPISLIRQALGHSREEITMAYLGITAEEVEDVYKRVNL